MKKLTIEIPDTQGAQDALDAYVQKLITADKVRIRNEQRKAEKANTTSGPSLEDYGTFESGNDVCSDQGSDGAEQVDVQPKKKSRGRPKKQSTESNSKS